MRKRSGRMARAALAVFSVVAVVIGTLIAGRIVLRPEVAVPRSTKALMAIEPRAGMSAVVVITSTPGMAGKHWS